MRELTFIALKRKTTSVIHPSSLLTVFWINSQRRTHCLSIPANMYLDTSLGALCVDLALLKKPLPLFPSQATLTWTWHGWHVWEWGMFSAFSLSFLFSVPLLSQHGLSVWEVCAPKFNRVFSLCLPLDRPAQENSVRLILRSAEQSSQHSFRAVHLTFYNTFFSSFFSPNIQHSKFLCLMVCWRKCVTLVLLQDS